MGYLASGSSSDVERGSTSSLQFQLGLLAIKSRCLPLHLAPPSHAAQNSRRAKTRRVAPQVCFQGLADAIGGTPTARRNYQHHEVAYVCCITNLTLLFSHG